MACLNDFVPHENLVCDVKVLEYWGLCMVGILYSFWKEKKKKAKGKREGDVLIQYVE